MVTSTDRLSKFRKLPAREQRFLVAAAIGWLPAAGIALRLVGLARLQRWLARPDGRLVMELMPEEIERFATLLNLAARYTPAPSTCLTRSLVLVWLLKRRGVASRLRIGVRLADGLLDAHAWVEYRGVPVNDRQDIADQFAVFSQSLPLRAFSSR